LVGNGAGDEAEDADEDTDEDAEEGAEEDLCCSLSQTAAKTVESA
jgi:hypothetical protein